MWTTEVSRSTNATKEQIWKLWADIPNWNVWDNEVEYSELSGDFKKGTKGLLKPTGGPKSKFIISECDYLQTFVSRSFLPLGKIDFIHTITEINDALLVTHRIEITGLFTFLFSKVIGNNIKKTLPEAVEKLISLAEK